MKIDPNCEVFSVACFNNVVQIRCPAGLSVITEEDAYQFANRILSELTRKGFIPASLKNFKEDMKEYLDSRTPEEILAELDACSRRNSLIING